MKKSLLKYLACPNCEGKLMINIIDRVKKGEIIEGSLRCNHCNLNFPIISGVPRMLHDTEKGVKKASVAFSNEWSEFDFENNHDDTWPGLYQEKRLERFSNAFDIDLKDLKGKVILDAGCGNGRLAYNLSSKFDCEIVAMDLSSSVYNAFENYKSKKLHYIQGDVTKIPLRKESFDYIWSAGVIMCTPNTKKSFGSLVPLVKKGGTLYVWVYGWPCNNGPYKCKAIWGLWRLLIKKPVCIQKFFGYLYVYTAAISERIKGKKPFSLQVKQRKRILYDFLIPYMHQHPPEEVAQWFKDNNFTNLKTPIEDFRTFCGFGMRGAKK